MEPDFQAGQQPSGAATEVYEQLEFPSLLTRIKALVVDWCVVLAIFVGAGYIIGSIEQVPDWLRASIFIFMLFLYEPVMVSFAGGTLGHHALRIRVKNVNDPEKNLFIVPALLRFVLKALLGWVSFLTVTFNERRRGIHDIGSGAIMVFSRQK